MRGRIALGILCAAILLAGFPTGYGTLQAQPVTTRAESSRACDAGYMYECGRLGSMMLEGTQGPKDPVAARQYHERACNGEVAISCLSIAVALTHGYFGGTADLRAALPYYAKACLLGAADACTQEGLAAHQLGDFSRSRAASIKGCQGGSAGGCRSTGILMRDGKGGPVDRIMAAAYFDQACRMNNQTGCQNLATLRSQGALPATLPAIRITPTVANEGRRPAVAAPPAAGTMTAAQRRYVNILNEHNAKVRIATSSIQNATVGTGKREKCIWLNDAKLNMQEAMRMAEEAHRIAVQERFEAYFVTGAQEVIERGNALLGKVTTEQRELRC